MMSSWATGVSSSCSSSGGMTSSGIAGSSPEWLDANTRGPAEVDRSFGPPPPVLAKTSGGASPLRNPGEPEDRGSERSTMRYMTDRVRERWARGEAAPNAWLTFEGAAAAAIVAEAGFDALTLDLQHGAAHLESVGAVAAAIETAGAGPVGRLRGEVPGFH